ncbi:MAG: response regulator transcription factor [Firmicutes bacterium]|nr:response regulator transcription factor [Bacillota bacterium]
MIKVLIAEDQSIVRECIKSAIEKDPEITVTGCCANGEEALQACEREIPQVALMDIGMPVLDGLQCSKIMKSKYPNLKIIILTIFEDDQNVLDALNYGADGYVLKDITPQELILTIKSVAAGLSIMNKSALAGIVNQAKQTATPPGPKKTAQDFNLTERELAAIRLIVNGKDYKEMAATLYLSEGSVRNLVSEILQKLNLKDRVQLAVFAVKNDLYL